MKFWDSSALVPLLVLQPSSEALLALYRDDPDVVAWWCTPTECTSAVTRLERDALLTPASVNEALHRLDALAATWQCVQPIEEVQRTARRLLRTHPLRAADALQLAAAIVVAESAPDTLPFVSLDARLSLAAQREGFALHP